MPSPATAEKRKRKHAPSRKQTWFSRTSLSGDTDSTTIITRDVAPASTDTSKRNRANSKSTDLSTSEEVPSNHAILSQPDLLALSSSPPSLPPSWPLDLPFLQSPTVSPYLTQRQRMWLRRKPPVTHPYDYSETPDNTGISKTNASNSLSNGAGDTVPAIKLPVVGVQSPVEIKMIQDPNHPAHGQRGLFAIRDLRPGEFVLPYFGYVHSSTVSEQQERERQKHGPCTEAILEADSKLTDDHGDTKNTNRQHHNDETSHSIVDQQIGSWDKSDYDLNLYRDEDIELAIDAAEMGNEARFCNDYRGVPAFNDPAVPVNSSRAQNGWDRRAKRAARTSDAVTGTITDSKSHDEDNSAQLRYDDHAATMAIPNAEFGDVWFEWTIEAGEESTSQIAVNADTGHSTRDQAETSRAIDSMTRLHIGPPENSFPGSFAADNMAKPASDHVTRKRKKRKDKTGMRGVGIFILPAGKSGKRKHGVKAGQELLVSYGKGFWAHHAI